MFWVYNCIVFLLLFLYPKKIAVRPSLLEHNLGDLSDASLWVFQVWVMWNLSSHTVSTPKYDTICPTLPCPFLSTGPRTSFWSHGVIGPVVSSRYYHDTDIDSSENSAVAMGFGLTYSASAGTGWDQKLQKGYHAQISLSKPSQLKLPNHLIWWQMCSLSCNQWGWFLPVFH